MSHTAPTAPDAQPPARIHIAVTHTTHQITHYTVPPGQGWKVDPAMRCLVIGRGVPRTYVPLDTVLTFEIEEA